MAITSGGELAGLSWGNFGVRRAEGRWTDVEGREQRWGRGHFVVGQCLMFAIRSLSALLAQLRRWPVFATGSLAGVPLHLLCRHARRASAL
jgi:hypothetical protein